MINVPHMICFAITLLCLSKVSAQVPKSSFNVIDFGGVGDGTKDDSQAFLKAWGSLCGGSSARELIVPEGKTFLVNPVKFQGPCKSPSISLQILGEIVAPKDMAAFKDHLDNWLQFWNVNGLTVTGGPRGKINGQGPVWWDTCSKDPQHCPQRPAMVMFYQCNNLKLVGLKVLDSPNNFITLMGGTQIEVSNLDIQAPENSPNTDGIKIAGSTSVFVHDSHIASGDDCIAINNHARDVNITQLSCGPGHGISIGSLGQDTTELVRVWNCNLTGTKNGVRIKTWEGGNGFARNISFENITLSNVSNPILIDQYYCPNRSCSSGGAEKTAVKISEITYKQIIGTTTTDAAIFFNCSRVQPGCTNIEVDRVNITSIVPGRQTYARCVNAHGTQSRSSNNPLVTCLS